MGKAKKVEEAPSRLLLVSDFHIRQRTPKELAIEGDDDVVMAAMVDVAHQREVDAVLDLGDQYDTPFPTDRDVSMAYSHLQNLRCPYIPIYGNHNVAVAAGWCLLPAVLGKLDVRSLERGGVLQVGHARIAGFDWQPPHALFDRIAMLPSDANVLMMHQTFEEYSGGFRRGDLSINDLPKFKQPIAVCAGDVHKLMIDTASPGKLFISPGSGRMTAIDEDPQKYFVLLEVFASGQMKAAPIPIPSRPVFRFLVRSDAELADLMKNGLLAVRHSAERDTLPRSIRMPVVEIKYMPLEDVYDRLMEAFNGVCHLKLVRLPTAVGSVVASDDSVEINTIHDALREIMAGGFDIKMEEFLRSLLNENVDYDNVVAHWRKHFAA